jgi:polyhydroxyalkanoate synthase
MTGQDGEKVQMQTDGNVPGPDVMLRLWASWMDQMSAPAHTLADPATAWWQMTTDNPASNLIGGGVNQLQNEPARAGGHCGWGGAMTWGR